MLYPIRKPKLKRRRRYLRRAALVYEPLEERRLLAMDFHNAFNPYDVDDNGYLVPLDALLVINDLNAEGPRSLASSSQPPAWLLDVSGDDELSSVDALEVINQLDAIAELDEMPPALATGLAPESDPNGNGVVLLESVIVNGQTTPGAAVRLKNLGAVEPADGGRDVPGQLTVADAQGHFQFQVGVSTGSNVLRLDAVDELGQGVAVVRTVRLGDVILDWNASMLNVIRDWTALSNDPYTNRIVPERPPVAARNLAMVHAAMYDAVNAIDGTYQPYHTQIDAPEGASPVAAAAAAAQRVASKLYKDADELAVFNAALVEALAAVPDGPAETLGVALGQQVGDAIFALRSTDGAGTPVPYAPGTDPGDWNRTFPDFLPPLLPHWPRVTPFAMTSGSQFRPPAPPALDSAEYAADVDEVMRLGGLESTERTADQTAIALFWADGGGTFTPPGHWNQIAADIALDRGQSLIENARLFALLNFAEADAGICSWDAKYAYNLWRPIDAIRDGDTDGNAATVADPTWTTLIKTPPFPTYTSGHSTFSGAANAVLTEIFGDNVHFSTEADGHTGFTQRPLSEAQVTTREFNSFSHAADEAGRSRIYGGIHFQFDNSAGQAAGRAIGNYVVANFLRLSD